MGFDQKPAVTIHVVQGQQGKWDVIENEFEDPLASFDSEQDARHYANALSKTKGGTIVSNDADATKQTSKS